MRIGIRAVFFIVGISLVIMSGLFYFSRQAPSTAYWVLGQINSPDSRRLQLTSPVGDVRHHIADGTPQNTFEIWDWLADGNAFIYGWHSAGKDEIRLFRLDDPGHEKVLTSRRTAIVTPNWRLPYQFGGETSHVLALRNADGAALFRLSADANSIEQISPYYRSIQDTWPSITIDGEWIYYEAANLEDETRSIFRQHLDGSGHAEVIAVDGTVQLIRVGESDMLALISNFRRVETSVYRITADNPQPQLIFSHFATSIFPIYVGPEWITFRDFVNNTVFRIRPDGSEYTEILNGLVFATSLYLSQDALYFVPFDVPTVTLIRRDLETLTDVALIPDGTFDSIAQIWGLWTHHSILLQVHKGEQIGLYRINTDGSDLRLVSTLDQPIKWLYLYYHADWIIMTIDEGTAAAPRIAYYRININTGEKDRLLTINALIQNLTSSSTPVDGEFILTVTTVSRNRIDEQYYINLLDGSVKQVLYGTDLRFSAIIDTSWRMALVLGLAILMLASSIGWSIWIARRDIQT